MNKCKRIYVNKNYLGFCGNDTTNTKHTKLSSSEK